MVDEEDCDIHEGVGETILPVAGLFRERNHGGLSCRSSFVPNNQSYMLYYWELMDKHDLLRSSFQKLNDDTASTDGGLSVLSTGSSINDRESKMSARNGKYINKLMYSIE